MKKNYTNYRNILFDVILYKLIIRITYNFKLNYVKSNIANF